MHLRKEASSGAKQNLTFSEPANKSATIYFRFLWFCLIPSAREEDGDGEMSAVTLCAR